MLNKITNLFEQITNNKNKICCLLFVKNLFNKYLFQVYNVQNPMNKSHRTNLLFCCLFEQNNKYLLFVTKSEQIFVFVQGVSGCTKNKYLLFLSNGAEICYLFEQIFVRTANKCCKILKICYFIILFDQKQICVNKFKIC